jgi:hypothetical protein
VEFFCHLYAQFLPSLGVAGAGSTRSRPVGFFNLQGTVFQFLLFVLANLPAGGKRRNFVVPYPSE